jgi:succinate dehydrogenase flavin-adding protein (antitoxin of CptAB toxin-antitoxin module)
MKPKLMLPVLFSDDPDLYEWLRERSFIEKRSMAEIVREAIREKKEQQELNKKEVSVE